MNIAVILAGGSGTRLGNDIPKQFLKVAGKKVLEHTIEVFENAKNIDEICIVSRIDCINDVESIVVDISVFFITSLSLAFVLNFVSISVLV